MERQGHFIGVEKAYRLWSKAGLLFEDYNDFAHTRAVGVFTEGLQPPFSKRRVSV